MSKPFDVIIVGAGPAGIFAANELAKDADLDILILEKGPDIFNRACPISVSKLECVKCTPCETLSGWGGAGAFSDGKLLLDMTGGFLYRNRNRAEEVKNIIKDIDDCYQSFGAPKKVYDISSDEENIIQQKALECGLRFVPARIRHLGTDACVDVLKRMRTELANKVTVECNSPADTIITNSDRTFTVKSFGRKFTGRTLLLSPGRGGAEWLKLRAESLGLKTHSNPFDIGVRVEVPKSVTAPLTDLVFESKFIYKSKRFKDKVRTFCMCPGGEVVPEYTMGVVTVNGHGFAHKETDRTNFAVLVSIDPNSQDSASLWKTPLLNSNKRSKNNMMTDPDKNLDPLSYGKALATLANLMGGVIVQRLGDFNEGRSTSRESLLKGKVNPSYKGATPGDLGLLLPWRYLNAIMEMLETLDKVLPGVYSPDTLLYGLEVKFYSSRLELTEDLETEIEGLFAAGDGAGVSRGLIQASVSGVMAARGIKKRLGKK
jgi:hypothetical protein